MADAFSLLVSLDPPYRALAPEVAGRYAELAGGSSEDAAALASAVTAAIDRVSVDADPHGEVGLQFAAEASGIRVDLSCGSRRESVDVTIPVAKR